MPFPDGEYTPFGYLRNPRHRALGRWERLEGGNLRTADETVGMEWVYPWHRGPTGHAGISITCSAESETVVGRADFESIGYTSRYHSANVMGFDWVLAGVAVTARFFLVEDVLCLHLRASNRTGHRQTLTYGIVGRVGVTGAGMEQRDQDTAAVFETGLDGVPRVHALLVSPEAEVRGQPALSFPISAGERCLEHRVTFDLVSGGSATCVATLSRGDEVGTTLARGSAIIPRVSAELQRAIADDQAFYEGCPTLAGDWPANWREGLVYDFETTRMCVLPASGIFQDVWPSWMVGWPRIVVAEGTLDMSRLAYADPETAKRALLTLFRDAPAHNVPCVFSDGSPNMVARDGTVCGTSPAWCLPFLNLELVYLRTLDRTWLADIFPHLRHYIEWWLEHRIDPDGWVVYKCTWEAGEDGNKRLDPSGSGDADISGRIRPVELQAALAYAARVLSFFAVELGRDAEARRWSIVFHAYRERTRAMFDPRSGRFRDWLIQEDRVMDDRPTESYWGSKSTRFSALSLTPALGEIATSSQIAALRNEIRQHAVPPWTIWPSWCHVLAECASSVGLHELAGSIAGEVIDHVYRLTNRRSLAGIRRPTPGVAPEYWPKDLRGWDASDAYGWGATTANLLLRHLCGLQESTDTSGWILNLTPAFPDVLQQAGARYVVRRFNYRGRIADVAFTWIGPTLDVEIHLNEPAHCSVTEAIGMNGLLYQSRRPQIRHTFRVTNGHEHRLRLY
ncbi:MAG: MGH1-like glycoside hydrolase domain-containing protein [Chloroflexota bacterium]